MCERAPSSCHGRCNRYHHQTDRDKRYGIAIPGTPPNTCIDQTSGTCHDLGKGKRQHHSGILVLLSLAMALLLHTHATPFVTCHLVTQSMCR